MHFTDPTRRYDDPTKRWTFVRQVLVGFVTLVLGAVVLAASGQVIFRPEFSLHEANQTAKFAEQRQELDDLKSIALDILCKDQPNHWRCGSGLRR